MTEQLERLAEPTATLDITTETIHTPPAAGTPVLISEAEVRFSTAAAVPLRPTTGWRVRASLIALAIRDVFAISTTDERRQPSHHPKRLRYLEDARMDREMYRL